ncbi:MAG: phospholipase D family protein [bacterium]|jgi:phosphatidylserine/phosphatidylglycerophosphate/cardiolipin synthase-like enzyme|nr:phospholipase D family protein [Betaproteobacteria bacterium]
MHLHPSLRTHLRTAGLACLFSTLAVAAPAGTAASATGTRESPAAQSRLFSATGTVQVAFTPGDPIDEILVGVIGQARQQVLVQAFSFTHKRIARALVDAHRRGVRVEVLADDRQDRQLGGSVLADLARNGVGVWLDTRQSSAHNKVMIVDSGTPAAVLVTGSYNFTYSAQRRNAENILVMRGNPALADAFEANWQRLRVHARPFRSHGGA